MVRWTPLQHNGAWDDIYAQCDADAQATLDSRLDQLLERGHLARRPVSAPLEDGIFELRAKKARVLFYFGAERTIVLYLFMDLLKTRQKSRGKILKSLRKGDMTLSLGWGI